MRARLAALATVVSVCAPAGAAAMDMGSPAANPAGTRTLSVTLPGQYFSPDTLSAVTGDTVNWAWLSGPHTVTGDTFDSGRRTAGASFSHTFTTPGTYTYVCQIHHNMRGVVRVSDILLTAPSAPSGPGRPYPLTGRTAAAAGSTVTIVGASTSAPATLASTTVGADGTFTAIVRPMATTIVHAVSGTETSPPVRVLVVDSKVSVRQMRRAGADRVAVSVSPADPGATVTLQLRLRERFGWWRVAVAKLDRHSRATFVLHGPRRAPARVNLTLADGWTVLATSPTIGVRGG